MAETVGNKLKLTCNTTRQCEIPCLFAWALPYQKRQTISILYSQPT